MNGWLLIGAALLVILLMLALNRKPDARYVFLMRDEQVQTSELNAIHYQSLLQSRFLRKVRNNWNLINAALSPYPIIKILIFLGVVNSAVWYINLKWIHSGQVEVCAAATLLALNFGYRLLIDRRRKAFNNDFPDALNILMSAVTAGESINSAFAYVSTVANNNIGREFKDISDRMRLGESTEAIFERSCKRFPYPPFLFFVLTIRANLERGGQLKGVLAKLIRVLVEARNLESKKMAMTSEARISAKIVGAIPFCFMVLLHWVSPKDLEFVLHNPDGRWILYYLLGSEGLGMYIVWWLVKSIR
ncbi:type II secretion system F family protein [Vibrio mediterranei]